MKTTILTLAIFMAISSQAVEHKELTDRQCDSITTSYYDEPQNVTRFVDDAVCITEHVLPAVINEQPSDKTAHIVGCLITIIGAIVRHFEKKALEKRVRREEQAKIIKRWGDETKVNY